MFFLQGHTVTRVTPRKLNDGRKEKQAVTIRYLLGREVSPLAQAEAQAEGVGGDRTHYLENSLSSLRVQPRYSY